VRRLAETLLTGLALMLMTAGALPAPALELKETLYFAHAVASGAMPPIQKRLPETPLIYRPDGKRYTLGRQGGSLRILMARPKDTRLMVVYGYARLVKYNEKYEIVPDLLENFTVEGGRIFTFTLRKGHKWSDGQPFTTEDLKTVFRADHGRYREELCPKVGDGDIRRRV